MREKDDGTMSYIDITWAICLTIIVYTIQSMLFETIYSLTLN